MEDMEMEDIKEAIIALVIVGAVYMAGRWIYRGWKKTSKYRRPNSPGSSTKTPIISMPKAPVDEAKASVEKKQTEPEISPKTAPRFSVNEAEEALKVLAQIHEIMKAS